MGGLSLLTVLARINPFFMAVHSKVLLYIDGAIQLVASRDSKWKQPADYTAQRLQKDASKRLIFIRHGESVWNEVFNRGLNIGLIGRLFRALSVELSFLAQPYSVLFDTPLNKEGLQQAREVAEWLESGAVSSDPAVNEVYAILRGEPEETKSGPAPANVGSLIVGSNLRRALSTVAIALKKRLERTGERIVIHSAAQEISRNVDCVASAEAGAIPHMEGPDSGDAAKMMALARDGGVYRADSVFNPALNSGQKPLDETGLHRLQHFADWIFTRPEHTIIVGGHSLWFRSFFKVFMAASDPCPGKTNKIENGGVVAVTLNRGRTRSGPAYWVEPGSVLQVHKGFEVKAAKDKKAKKK